MDSVVRNVSDLSANEKHVFENVLGQPLHSDQNVIVQLVEVNTGNFAAPEVNGTENVLESYKLWADMSDEEIAELEAAILQRSDSRST
jgi:hypothetical protein